MGKMMAAGAVALATYAAFGSDRLVRVNAPAPAKKHLAHDVENLHHGHQGGAAVQESHHSYMFTDQVIDFTGTALNLESGWINRIDLRYVFVVGAAGILYANM